MIKIIEKGEKMSIAVYKNGNAITKIDLNDGTKERYTDDDEFILEFPETLDVACTTYCDANCPYCYAGCSTSGKHADIMNAKFIDTLRPYTEIALQLNDLSHPDLFPFLEKIKSKKVIANITVNQIHFEQKEDLIEKLVNNELIKGIGISLKNPTPEFISRVQKYPNAIIHVINGIFKASDIEALRDKGLKILILGYKDLGRGTNFHEANYENIKARQRYLYDVLPTLPNHFEVLSMDNLAIEQLKPQRFIEKSAWDEIYMGDEGTASMFVDLVNGRFGISSLCKEKDMYPIMDTIDAMWQVIQSERNTQKGN